MKRRKVSKDELVQEIAEALGEVYGDRIEPGAAVSQAFIIARHLRSRFVIRWPRGG